MSNIVHDKYHRQNHHSFITSAVTDMGLDPIASKELPFSGEFVMDNADHETWLLSSDRAAFEWVSGYGDADTIKLDTNLSGALGKSITYPSGAFNNVAIDGGITETPVLSVAGKSVFTDDVIYNGDLKLDGNLTVPAINTVGISAGNVLISGDTGVVLDVTNGLSHFQDVTAGDFTITENLNVTGDITTSSDMNIGGDVSVSGGAEVRGNLKVDGGTNIHNNLSVNGQFSVGGWLSTNYDNGNILNVGGDIRADGHTIYADTISVNAQRSITTLLSDTGGIIITGGLSGGIYPKKLIPYKDPGAVSYIPGEKNMTLSAIGLSSDSWAAFNGNVRVGGDKFYDDANQTIFSGPVYFEDITSASHLSAENLSAENLSAENLSAENLLIVNSIIASLTGDDVYLTDASALKLSAYNLDTTAATAAYMSFTDLSGKNLSADQALVTTLTADNLIITNDIPQTISAKAFKLYNGNVTITDNSQWNNGLIAAKSIISNNCIYAEKTGRADSMPGAGTWSHETRVPNIRFCDQEYLIRGDGLSGYTGFGGEKEDYVCGYYDSTCYSYDVNWLPWLSTNHSLPCNIRTDDVAAVWYKAARNRIYVCGTWGGWTHRMKMMLTTYHINQNIANEFCYDLEFISDGNASLGSQFVFRHYNDAKSAWQGDLRIKDMYSTSGAKITMSNIRGGRSGTCRSRLRVHFCPDQYAIVEVLGVFNGSRPSSVTGWFLK